MPKKVRQTGGDTSIVGTFNGLNIIALPCDTIPRVTSPSSIEWDKHDVVSSSISPFSGQMQVYDWQASWWQGQVSFPPMTRYSYDAWKAFLGECRGPLNAFMLGDPKAKLPKGSALGAPVVDGAGQTGYVLATRGWKPNVRSILLFGDMIQIGYRQYEVTNAVDSDASGAAEFRVWPPLRDQPADGTAIVTRRCKGLFRLVSASGNKYSTNVGNYGLSGFAFREAI